MALEAVSVHWKLSALAIAIVENTTLVTDSILPMMSYILEDNKKVDAREDDRNSVVI